MSRFTEKYKAHKRQRNISKARRAREAEEGDVNRLTASDEIEENFGYRSGTSFHKAIIQRLNALKDVSSPSATNRVASVSIYFAWGVKVISILITFGVLDYIYKNSVSQNWDVPIWIIVPLMFILAAAIEIISSIFMKNILNTTEVWITRVTTLIIGLALTALITYSHVVYTELKNTINVQQNKEKVMHIETPSTIKLRGQILDANKTIASLEQSIADQIQRYNQSLTDIDVGALAYKEKGEKYQSMVDIATKKHQKYIFVNGKNNKVSRVQGWANTNMKLYRNELAKKKNINRPTSPQVERYRVKKEALENTLEAEYNKEKTAMDEESTEKGNINLYLQLLISFLAKIDLYGYFVLRHNIKNRVLDQMHKIIDNFNVTNQLSGVMEQFSLQTGQVMKAIGLTGIKVQNELAGINRAIVTDGNRQLQSNHRLIQALAVAPIDIEANYTPTGDSRIDIVNEHEEMEEILTNHIKEMGYNVPVVLDDHVEVGKYSRGVIHLNPHLSEENMAKALRHELQHIEAGTHKHDETFREAAKKIDEKKIDFTFTKVKKHLYDIPAVRAIEIYRDYSLAKELNLTRDEQRHLTQRGVFIDGKIVVKDSLQLMDALDI